MREVGEMKEVIASSYIYMHKKFTSTSQNFTENPSRKQMNANWDRIYPAEAGRSVWSGARKEIHASSKQVS